MILTNLSRGPDPINATDLSQHVSSAISKSVWMELLPDQAIASGLSISENDRAAIQTAINNYQFVDPIAPVPPIDTSQYIKSTDARLTDARTPTAHTHPISDVTNLQTALNAKSDTNHTHTKAQITDFNHTHAASDITSGSFNIAQIPTGTSATTVALGNHTHPAPTPTYALLAGAATAMGFGTTSTVKISPTANATYTTTVPAAGTTCTLIILTTGTTSRTITFGTGFKMATATLATGTVAARVFVVGFISDGTSLYETYRTVALVA